MQPAPGRSELFGDRIDECRDVVIGDLLDLGDSLRCRGGRPRANLRDVIRGGRADLSPGVERGELDVEPAREPAFVRPDPGHGGAGVTRDHRCDSREGLGRRPEDSRGEQLAEDDDSGGFLDARITYRIIATSYEPGKTGAYTLTVYEGITKVLVREVNQVAAAGAELILFTALFDQRKQMERLAAEVLPKLG